MKKVFQYGFILVCIFLGQNSGAITSEELSRIMPEPGQSPQSVYEILESYILNDPDVSPMIAQANESLRKHNLGDLSSIISFCEEDGRPKTNLAAFHFRTKVIESRTHIRGVPPQVFPVKAWSQKAQDEMKNSFLSHVYETPVTDVLMTFDQPNICLRKGQGTADLARDLVHEIYHFLNINPIEAQEFVYGERDLNTFSDFEITRGGGELEAVEFATPFFIRLYKRAGITPSKAIEKNGVDQNGGIFNPILLKNIIMTAYQEGSRKKMIALISRKEDFLKAQLSSFHYIKVMYVLQHQNDKEFGSVIHPLDLIESDLEKDLTTFEKSFLSYLPNQP